ncbi:hypothetical protein [Streptomyces hygroscopicus]|uniref:hypothetical protein n=1 Tax=Streptomyces hygroscopicus TaxID=1912 RepID=UPI000B14C7CA
MGNTGPAELLAIWEAGLAHHGPGRALLLHRAARPETGADELLSLPVGEREADLYALRRALFGERMQVRAECGACGEAMEFDLDTHDLTRDLTSDLAARPRGQDGGQDGPLRVEEGEWTVEFRLPTVADLEAAARAATEGGGDTGARTAAEAGGRGVSGADGDGFPGAGGPTGAGGPLGAGGPSDAGGGGAVGGERAAAGDGAVGGDHVMGGDHTMGGGGAAAGDHVMGGDHAMGGGGGVGGDHVMGGDHAMGGEDAMGGEAAVAGGDATGASTAAARARRALLARCVVSVHRSGQPVPADRLPAAELPEPVQRRLAEAAERADPAADVTLNVACPACGAATRAELDIASYLWAELDHWARDLLLDVHLLATAYGWSEPQILALSPLRRRYYLELCADG